MSSVIKEIKNLIMHVLHEEGWLELYLMLWNSYCVFIIFECPYSRSWQRTKILLKIHSTFNLSWFSKNAKVALSLSRLKKFCEILIPIFPSTSKLQNLWL